MVSKLALLPSFRMAFHMKEYNPLASLQDFCHWPIQQQDPLEFIKKTGNTYKLQGHSFRTSVFYGTHTPPDECFHLPQLQHCYCFYQRKAKASQETSEMGILSKFSSLCQSATLSFIIWLCLFPSYCLQVLSTEHQSRIQDEKKSP